MQRIPERVRRVALEPDHDDLRNVDNDVYYGHGDQAASDFEVCSVLETSLRQPQGQIWERTALRIHLNQKRRDCHLSDWDGQVEKEDRCPGEEEEVMELAGFYDDVHVVSEAM